MADPSTHNSGWSVLLEDGPVLVINKPAGLLTQAPAAVPSLEGEIKAWIKVIAANSLCVRRSNKDKIKNE